VTPDLHHKPPKPDPRYQRLWAAAVRIWQATPRRFEPGKNGRLILERLQKYFDEILLPQMSGAFPEEPPEVLSVFGLGPGLGPRQASCPPDEMVAELLAMVRQHAPRSPVEIMIALGGGWHRPVTWGPTPWHDLWGGARQEIETLVHRHVVHTWKVLNASVPGFDWPELPDGSRNYYVVREYSGRVHSKFLCPPPPEEDEEKEKKDGTVAAKKFQSLLSWDPAAGNLYGWVRHTIQGSPGRLSRFQAGWFAGGLLYPELKADGALLAALAAIRRCVKNPKPFFWYSTEACQECFFTKSRIFASPRLIVPGQYAMRPFWKCTAENGGHGYFELGLPCCRECKKPHGCRPTHLVVFRDHELGDDPPSDQQDDSGEEL
jgi:hypothetical protein